MVRSLGGNHLSVKGPVTLTVEICCRILAHPVYFCDGVTTPLLGFDAISAASLVIDTEARQIWSKDTVMYENTVPFDTSSTAEPCTVVNSSNISLTTTDSSPSTIVLPSSVVDLSTTAAAVTTTVSSSPVIDASAATMTSSDIVVSSEIVRLPTRESSEPCDYCSAALTTSSSTTTDLDDCVCDSDRFSGVRFCPA